MAAARLPTAFADKQSLTTMYLTTRDRALDRARFNDSLYRGKRIIQRFYYVIGID